MKPNVITVLDGCAGSCGKGKVASEIATMWNINLGASVTNCMPNAGHTYMDKNGKIYVFRNIPIAVINPNTELFISPGSAIDMEVFIDEYERIEPFLNGRKIYVHKLVPLIEERHKIYEREHIGSGSTFKGCGAVTKDKVMRDKDLKFFKGYKNAVVCSDAEWLDRLYSHLDNPNEYVMLEGSQGCDLSLNHGGEYPHVTSRNVSTAQLFADAGISLNRILQTIMVIRPFPIRINNYTKDGEYHYTGNVGTGRELTWSEINIASMCGDYPFDGMIEDYYKISNDLIDYKYFVDLYLKECPKIYLLQVFGENYKNITSKDVTFIQALEIERLYHKSKGEKWYESNFVDLPLLWAKDSPTLIYDQSEQTTVTKMERRIFDLDIKKIKNNVRINEPVSLYLNFFQHLNYDDKEEIGAFRAENFEKKIRNYLQWLESETKKKIIALGTGPKVGEYLLQEEFADQIEVKPEKGYTKSLHF